jgi:hypothetical protein
VVIAMGFPFAAFSQTDDLRKPHVFSIHSQFDPESRSVI